MQEDKLKIDTIYLKLNPVYEYTIEDQRVNLDITYDQVQELKRLYPNDPIWTMSNEDFLKLEVIEKALKLTTSRLQIVTG